MCTRPWQGFDLGSLSAHMARCSAAEHSTSATLPSAASPSARFGGEGCSTWELTQRHDLVSQERVQRAHNMKPSTAIQQVSVAVPPNAHAVCSGCRCALTSLSHSMVGEWPPCAPAPDIPPSPSALRLRSPTSWADSAQAPHINSAACVPGENKG